SLFIAFRKNDTWGTPVYMDTTVSMPKTGNIEARLSPDHRTLYFSSTRLAPPPDHPSRAASEHGLELMEKWNNGLANIWRVSLRPWLTAEAR
ncbi:MAG: hypothetical protein ACREMU_08370, partial [Gemmatimonadaceae bacterium]